ncbi:MAG: ATP-binding protein [Symploca sp. SIO2G7]|nr:ATP-binding protein [Symploca sp. SIO2G7]
MRQIFGDFIELLPNQHNSLELSFTSNSEDIDSPWKNQRLSAYFLANCFINFLPFSENNPAEHQRIKELKSSISYVANELIENAVKFNLETANYQVKLGIHFLEEPELVAVMFATNAVDQVGAQKLQTFIQKLLAADLQDFYIQQIEASSKEENSSMSGLGFLTMINDYDALLGWKFEPLSTAPDITAITVTAQIKV